METNGAFVLVRCMYFGSCVVVIWIQLTVQTDFLYKRCSRQSLKEYRLTLKSHLSSIKGKRLW